METIKESLLRRIAEKQELGQLPKLTTARQELLEARIDAFLETLRGILADASLSDLESLQKFVAFLHSLNWRDCKASSQALKRHRRQKMVARKTGRNRRRERRKRFRQALI